MGTLCFLFEHAVARNYNHPPIHKYDHPAIHFSGLVLQTVYLFLFRARTYSILNQWWITKRANAFIAHSKGSESFIPLKTIPLGHSLSSAEGTDPRSHVTWRRPCAPGLSQSELKALTPVVTSPGAAPAHLVYPSEISGFTYGSETPVWELVCSDCSDAAGCGWGGGGWGWGGCGWGGRLRGATLVVVSTASEEPTSHLPALGWTLLSSEEDETFTLV